MPETSLEPLITECPSCRTRFRVSETQLGAAGGRVRCGACLSVFQGTDYLIFGTATSETSETPGPELDELLDELDDATRPEPPAAGKPTSLIERASDAARKSVEKDSSITRPRSGAAVERVPEPAVEPAPAEVPDALDIVTRELAGVRTEVEEIELTAPAFEGKAAETSMAPADTDEAKTVATRSEPVTTEQAQAEAQKFGPVRGEAAKDDRPTAEATKAETKVAGTAKAETSSPLAKDLREPAPTGGAVTDEPRAAPSRSARERSAEPQVVEAVQRSLSPFPAAEEPAPRRRRRWWLPVALVLVIAIVAQVLWLQFATWSVDLQMRPVYELACRYLGCTLPVMRDLTAIHARNLAVRSNPDVPGSLLVDALIVNEAPFAQPFPSIELRFSSMSGSLVASRRFAASEYLSGELAGAKSMQPRTPIHISIDVDDPGNDAVNYVFVFL